MMRAEGWRGKSREVTPRWRVQARRAKSLAVTKNFSMGGLPRRKPGAAVSLPKLRCQDDPA